MPVGLALQGSKHGFGRGGLALKQGAYLLGKTRRDHRAFLFGPGKIERRINDGSKRRGAASGGNPLRRLQRIKARRIDDVVVVRYPLLACRVQSEAYRQDAERTRWQPHQARAGFDTALFQGREQTVPTQAPQRRAKVIDGSQPLWPPL